MFDNAEIGHKISKKAYSDAVPALRSALLDAQARLFAEAKVPVLVLVSGPDGAGKGETINTLYEWMDPRCMATLAFELPTEEELARPPMWRYWKSLPAKGHVGVFAGSWYSDPIRERAEGKLSAHGLDAKADCVNRFEQMLANEGALVLKFWLHLSKGAQRRRLKELEADPNTAWRVTPWNWDRLKTYDKTIKAAGHMLRLTNSACAPWIVVEGVDERYRNIAVGSVILEAMLERLDQSERPSAPVAPMVRLDADGRDVLNVMDLSLALAEGPCQKQLAKWQGRLSELVRDPRFADKSLVCAFEGADAAGKGGAIRRVGAALDARQYAVVPVGAPTEEERSKPYLWRFWRALPRRGRVAMFDRTWYGRVLVERVEGLCAPRDWMRAYSEINDFEHELSESGVVVVKFWLQTSQGEQLRRFKERERVEFKRFKLTAEDWRNRDKWDAYQKAVVDMVERTSTGSVPWTLVEAEDKNYARVKILRTICERLEAELGACRGEKKKRDAKSSRT